MPKIRRNKKRPPAGWDEIEPMMDKFEEKMREAELAPHEGKRQVEILWPIVRIHHQRTRYWSGLRGLDEFLDIGLCHYNIIIA